MEWIALVACWIAGFGPFTVYVCLRIWYMWQANRRRGYAHAAQRDIDPRVRQEIEQSPSWWDEQFHKLLAETGQSRQEYGEVEYVEERSFGGSRLSVITLERPVAYDNCTCYQCKVTRAMGCDPRD